MDMLSIPLDRLTLGRAALYAAILEGSSLDPCHASLQHAVAGLRRSGNMDDLPLGLLTRAWLRSLEGKRTGGDSAQSDLDEAWEIAERGPMKLHMADIHLHRARLFFREAEYPWGSPRRRPRRRARAHREMRLRAAQGRAHGCRAGDRR
ncbi:MAG: hypothetical protein ACREXJ_04670, partial [Gammaproteobacteria bacterium]